MKKLNLKKVFMIIAIILAVACVCYVAWVVFSPKPVGNIYYLNGGEEILIGESTSTIALSHIIVPSVAAVISGTFAAICGIKIKKDHESPESR